MEQYLIRRYGFTKEEAAQIKHEYHLLRTNTYSELRIDEFVDVIKMDSEPELTRFEKKMIKAISSHTVYPEHEVLRIWKLCKKSYDKTIYCLEKSQALALLPEDLL